MELKRTPAMRPYLGIVFSLLSVNFAQVMAVNCPTTCKCRSNAVSQTTMRCYGGGLSAPPSGLDATVQFLYMSGTLGQPNTITALQRSHFQPAAQLFSLVVSYSQVRTIQDGAFTDLTNLHELTLSNNDIQALTAETFKGLSQLRTLDISHNPDCVFDRSMFTYITQIEELNLGGMNLRKVPEDMFASLQQLKVLRLQLNNIKKIHENVILALPALETLDLNGNLLRGIPAEWESKFKTMQQIHISENPLQCNCQLLWLRRLPEKFYSSRIDTSTIVCNGPEKVKYASFVNVPESEFVCIPPDVVHCEQTSYALGVGQKLIISCDFDGDPIPEIKWTRPDGFEIDERETVKGQYEIYENGTLVVDAVSITDDDGTWQVMAYNKTDSDTMDIQVDVILTTTSTSTTSRPTTVPSTTQKTTNAQSTSPVSTGASSTSSKLSTILTGVVPSSTVTQPHTHPSGKPPSGTSTAKPNNNSPVNVGGNETVTKTGFNFGHLVAAAFGGATVVGLISIISMCCKKKKKGDKNQIEHFGFDDYK